MAFYVVTYRCKHERRIEIKGKYDVRRVDISRYKKYLCPDCRECSAHNYYARAAEENAKRGLFPLRGTPNQIIWAEKIRHKFFCFVDAFDKKLDSRRVHQPNLPYLLKGFHRVVTPAKQAVEAVFFINNRASLTRSSLPVLGGDTALHDYYNLGMEAAFGSVPESFIALITEPEFHRGYKNALAIKKAPWQKVTLVC